MEKNASKPELFERFLAEKSNAAELNQLFNYFESADQGELENLISAEFEGEADLAPVADQQIRLEAIHSKLSAQLFTKPINGLLKRVKMVHFIKIAAVLLVFLSITLLIAKFSFEKKQVVPGSATAMLVVGGKQTELGVGKTESIYQQKGVTVSTKPDGTIVFMAINADSATASQLNTVSTPSGGEYKITLTDGSIVMLNAGSKLTFPTGFRGSERKVQVEGEAFFKVAKNPAKPFIVSVAGNEIEVLGTQFNVSSYPEDEGTAATLLEGSIKFSSASSNVVLKPNQRVLATHGKLDVESVSAEDFNAWTRGEFLFNDVPLAVVMQKLARWYKVDVNAALMPKKNLYIKISRKADFNEVLEMISKATGYEFELEGNKIVFRE